MEGCWRKWFALKVCRQEEEFVNLTILFNCLVTKKELSRLNISFGQFLLLKKMIHLFAYYFVYFVAFKIGKELKPLIFLKKKCIKPLFRFLLYLFTFYESKHFSNGITFSLKCYGHKLASNNFISNPVGFFFFFSLK